jgi:hypothetical protein
MCGICRSIWAESTLCLACVERLMAGREKTPEYLKTHRWQAAFSVLLSSVSWILAIIAMPVLGARSTDAPKEFVNVVLALTAVSLVPSLFALGQAAAAIRVRGDRMTLATCGLVLSGAQIGTITGLMLLVSWKQ